MIVDGWLIESRQEKTGDKTQYRWWSPSSLTWNPSPWITGTDGPGGDRRTDYDQAAGIDRCMCPGQGLYARK